MKTPFKAIYKGISGNKLYNQKVLVVNTEECSAHSPYVKIEMNDQSYWVDINDLKY
jgi:hypothetical protein|tara:strand:+ start:438 stop:605 length:168 start_codon:yes stop_codon:yes gene_type:complete